MSTGILEDTIVSNATGIRKKHFFVLLVEYHRELRKRSCSSIGLQALLQSLVNMESNKILYVYMVFLDKRRIARFCSTILVATSTTTLLVE